MPGYQLDGLDNTSPIGLDTSNALDKQPTSSDFLGTVRVVDLPLDQSAPLFPGNGYIADPSGSYIQGATFASGASSISSQAVAFPSNVTAGDLIIVAVGWASVGPTASVTDSQGNTYGVTPGAPFVPTTIAYAFQIFYAVAGSTGANTVTVTLSSASTFVRILIHEYAGWQAFDVAAPSLSYNGATATSVVTTTANNDLIFAWCVDNSGVNSFSAPFALRQTVGSEATGDNLKVGMNGSYTVTCNTAGGNGGMLTASFKAAVVTPTFNPTGTGAITFGGSGTATVTVNPTGTGAIAFAGAATATVTVIGTGTGAITFGGSGTATAAFVATGTGAIVFGGSGTATVILNPTGTGAITFAGSGTAVVTVNGVGTGAITFGGSAAATVTVTPTGTGAITFAGSGTGTVTVTTGGTGAIVFGGSGIASFSGFVSASGTGAITFGGAGTATVTVAGTGTGAIVFGGSGVAHVVSVATGTGAITFGGSGSASVQLTGVGTGAITFAGSAVATWTGGSGVPAPPLTATVALRPITLVTVARPSTGLVAVSQRLPASITVALDQIPVIAVPLP